MRMFAALCVLWLSFAARAGPDTPGGSLGVVIGSPAAGSFSPGSASQNGIRAVCDIPPPRHIRNVGGSDGAGLCVFTSVELAADWQNLTDFRGFQKWMTRRPGGGWPEKLDDMVSRYCADKGVPVPRYVQHTGGDEAFLDAAIRTGRMVCITYSGRDDFYRGRVAHMVDLAHIDGERAAIIDNNRPGVWVWMTRAELLDRWREMGGGWAFVWLAPPPPPHLATGPLPPNAPPVPQPSPNRSPWGPGVYPSVEGCPSCNTPHNETANYVWLGPYDDPKNGEWWVLSYGGATVGYWDERGWHRWLGADTYAAVDGTPCPTEPPVMSRRQEYLTGVVADKIPATRRYAIGGDAVSREQAFAAFGDSVPSDGDKWHLTAVGTADFATAFRSALSTVPVADRSQFHVQVYPSDAWAVSHFGLPDGVSARRPCGADRASADAGSPMSSVECIGLGDRLGTRLADWIGAKLRPRINPLPDVLPHSEALIGWVILAGLIVYLFRRSR